MKRLFALTTMTVALTLAPPAHAQVVRPVQKVQFLANRSPLPERLPPVRRVSLDQAAGVDLRGVTPGQALATLRDRTGLRILFSPSLLPTDRTVACRCEGVSIREALGTILAGTGFHFTEVGDQVLVEPSERPAPRPRAAVATTAPTALLAPPVVATARPVRALARRQGTIGGRVTDATTGQPLSGVQVHIATLDIGALTGVDGVYSIARVPVGTHTVVAEMIGYGTARQQVTVGEGSTVQVNFRLTQQAVQLDEVVVTGTPGGLQRRAIGNVVGEVDAAASQVAPINDLSHLLAGREPGVEVQVGQGSPGTASVIRIRGQASLSASNQPLVYVDGVRVNSRMSTPQGGSTPAAISRMDDFAPGEIERIEVIKGPAAATLYGTEASNGVINIITKKGAFNQRARWTFSTKQGANWFANPEGHTPTNWGLDSNGNLASVNLVAHEKALGNNVFHNGRVQEYSLDVSGGSEDVSYFVSGSALNNDGVTPESWQKKYNARVSVTAQAGDHFTVDGNAGLVLLHARVPGRGTSDGAMRSLWLGLPRFVDTPKRGFYRAPPEAFYEKAQFYQDVNRLTTGVTVNYTPFPWFHHRLTFGVDVTDQKNTNFTPYLSEFAAQFFSANDAAGSKDVRQETVLQTSFDYAASANWNVSPTLASTTSAGMQVNTKKIDQTRARGEGFPAVGIATVDGAASTFGYSDLIENNTVGIYVQEQLGWRDRMFLTAAVRADDNSAFGENFSLVYYPKVSGSWVLSDEDWWGLDFMNSFRLRGAYGESGQQPDVFDALRTYTPRAQPNGSAAVYPDAPGNSNLGPERGQEIEAGFDASMWNDRLSLEFTFYNQVTKDAIVARDVAPSTGFSAQKYVNIGKVSNRGIEVGLNARVLDLQSLDWDLGLNLDTNRNRVEELGLGGGFLALGWTTRHAEGYPAASFFAPKVVSADLDANGDPINMMCADGHGGTVNCEESAPRVYAGHPDPSLEGSLTSSFTLADKIQLSAMADFKFGQSNYSTLTWWRYTGLPMAGELFQPNPDPKLKAAEYLGRFGEFQLWVPKASFARLREITLTSPLPDSWVQRIGAQQGRLSVAAQNVAMLWTNYFAWPYQDPEVRAPANVLGGNREPENTAAVPPLMSLTFTLRLTY